jgi:hypothetical protein
MTLAVRFNALLVASATIELAGVSGKSIPRSFSQRDGENRAFDTAR